MICCPLTMQMNKYPFEVLVSGASPSVVLANPGKGLDWRVRKAKRKGSVSARERAEMRPKIAALIG